MTIAQDPMILPTDSRVKLAVGYVRTHSGCTRLAAQCFAGKDRDPDDGRKYVLAAIDHGLIRAEQSAGHIRLYVC